MQDLPHHYRVEARAGAAGDVALRAASLPDLPSQPPAEFGGPGDRWSPETLLLAAVADCYALSFRVLAANSKVGFSELACRAEGEVDRADGKIRFTRIALDVEVALAGDANRERAQRLLERAKDVCIVSNSLSVPVTLDARIAAAAG
jgi:organic hydroperoxide reductase OsmC/OhrA